MNCAFDKEKLSGYYDGELDAAEKAEVERHIASCSECLRELGELKSAALLVKELPRLRAPRLISEGIAREIQAAGKVHQFAKVRRNLLWACAAAAGVFVVLNIAYFVRVEHSPSVAVEKPAPSSIASVPAPADKAVAAPEPRTRQDEALRRAGPGRAERERSLLAEEERRGLPVEAKKEELPKRDEVVRKAPADPARPVPAAAEDKPVAARAPAAKPAELPAPPPPAPPAAAPKPASAAPSSAPLAGKEDARPAEPMPEKAAGARLENFGKDSDVKAKRTADPQGEAPPTHFTLASTQLSKARPVMEDTLRKMGVKIPSAPSAMVKGMPAKSAPTESTFTLELTESQITRLKQELEKSGHSRLVNGSPGDPVLAQFGDTGLYRATKKDMASGGGMAPGAKKVPESSSKGDTAKADSPKLGAPEPKDADREKDGKEAGETLKANVEGADKAQEPKRKIILHLLDVPYMPDSQPAPDPVKK
jgi:hypothetical protein